MECLDRLLQFNIMNITNDVLNSNVLYIEKTKRTKRLALTENVSTMRSVIFFLQQENYSIAETSWQVKIDKEVEVCIYLGHQKRKKMVL